MALRGEQLATLNRLLDRLTAQDAGQREAWIDALEGDEALLAPVLRELLARPGGLEGTGADDATWAPPLRQAMAGALGAADGGFEAGAAVGPYRLLRPLGEGGMGMVWLAERTDGTLRRQVALKLPRPGLQRWRLDQRFQRERDILGSLEHPNIARLYEAGLAADGQPYLAMEYVAGRSITEHAETRQASVAQRLRLFLQVLGAVQHAHQRLVVHRDLKPSNILVDDEGRVRLLDFGIALLQDDSVPQAALTEVGQALLTPQYASPEQVARAPVSTASDLYSLGVVLCELLAGRGPYTPARDTRAALEEAILQGELLRPSRIAPADRRAALRGDLDNIVLKALKRQPAERYASADAMAQDLQRHLDGAPVSAHPDSAAYRLRKFARRNRLAVGAVSGISLALLAGIGVALWQAGVAREQASAARREAQRAQAVQAFLVGLFNEADPARAQGRELTARDLMARAERELQSELRGEPDSAAAVRGAMVDIYLKLGDETRALPLAQAQVEQARRRQGPRSLETAQALAGLGQALSRHARSEEALQVLDEARELLAPLQATERKAWLDLQRLRAQTLLDLRRLPETEQLLQQILPAEVEQYGISGWEVITLRASLALAFALDARVADAEPIFIDLEHHLADVGPERATQAALLRSDMGYGWTVLGRWADAQRLLEQARADFDRYEGPRNSDSIRVQRTLATLLLDGGNYPAAATVTLDNARRSREFYGATDAEYGLDLSFAVIPLLMTGRFAEAEATARESVRIGTGSGTLTEGERNGLRRRMALALLFNGHVSEARPILQAVAEADPKVVVTRLYLSAAMRLQGQAEAAAGQAAEAAGSLRRRATMASQLMAGRALLAESLAWAAAGRADSARARYDDALGLLKPRLPAGHVLLTAAELMHAAVLRSAGQATTAAELERSTRAALQRQGVHLPPTLPLLP